jgi:hypothetical protein
MRHLNNSMGKNKNNNRVEMFFRRLGPVKIFFNYPNFYMASCITIAIVMNMLILLGFSIKDDNDDFERNKNLQLFFILDNESKSPYNPQHLK